MGHMDDRLKGHQHGQLGMTSGLRLPSEVLKELRCTRGACPTTDLQAMGYKRKKKTRIVYFFVRERVASLSRPHKDELGIEFYEFSLAFDICSLAMPS